MKRLDQKVAVVTGGSRGLGKGIVSALAEEGAQVWAIARDESKLDALKSDVTGVNTLALDIAEPETAERVLDTVKPDIMVLNAGAKPHMSAIQDQSWDQFTRNWNTDVKASFHFGQAALKRPMKPGSQVLTISSGAAISGSVASGGYAGAKRMQWFLSNYFQTEADRLALDIRFMTLLPKQIIGSTELGHEAASGYAARQGITKEAFLERFGVPLTPEAVGDGVVSLLLGEAFQEGAGFAITGKGIEKLN